MKCPIFKTTNINQKCINTNKRGLITYSLVPIAYMPRREGAWVGAFRSGSYGHPTVHPTSYKGRWASPGGPLPWSRGVPYRALINTLLLIIIHFELIIGVFNTGHFIFYVEMLFVATLVNYFRCLSNILGFV